MNRQSVAVLLVLAIPQIGCNTFAPKTTNKMADDPIAAPTEQFTVNATTPVRMAIVWNEKTLRPVGQPAVRGFTGRIYFYNQNDEPVTADGELTVFGYDDTQSNSHEAADRKYVYPAEKFATHYSRSELGHSYSIWVPWENYGGYRKAISLVPVFKLADNRLIHGSTNRVALTGQPPQDATMSQTQALEHLSQQSSHSSSFLEARPVNQNSPARRQADSFRMPQSMATRMQNLPPNWNPAANRQLPNMDNPQINPQGDLYNQVHIRETTVVEPTPNQYPHTNQPQPSGTYSNFSDHQMIQPPPQNYTNGNENRPVYGKPGSFR